MIIKYSSRKNEATKPDKTKLTEQDKIVLSAREQLISPPNVALSQIPFVSKDLKIDDCSLFTAIEPDGFGGGAIGSVIDYCGTSFAGSYGFYAQGVKGDEAVLFFIYPRSESGKGDKYFFYHAPGPDSISSEAGFELSELCAYVKGLHIVIMVNNAQADQLFSKYIDSLNKRFSEYTDTKVDIEKSAAQIILWDALWGDFAVILNPGNKSPVGSFGHLSSLNVLHNPDANKLKLIDDSIIVDNTTPQEQGSVKGSGYDIPGTGLETELVQELETKSKEIFKSIGAGLFNTRIYSSVNLEYFQQPYSKYRRGNLGYILGNNHAMMQAQGLPFNLQDLPEDNYYYDDKNLKNGWWYLQEKDCCNLTFKAARLAVFVFSRKEGKYYAFTYFDVGYKEVDFESYFGPDMEGLDIEVLVICPHWYQGLISETLTKMQSFTKLFSAQHTKVFCWITQPIKICVSITNNSVLFGAHSSVLYAEPEEKSTSDKWNNFHPVQLPATKDQEGGSTAVFVANILKPASDATYCQTNLLDQSKPPYRNVSGKICLPIKLPEASYAYETNFVNQEGKDVLGCLAFRGETKTILGEKDSFLKNLVACKMADNSLVCVIWQRNPFIKDLFINAFVFHGAINPKNFKEAEESFCSNPEVQKAMLQFITYPEHCHMALAVGRHTFLSQPMISKALLMLCWGKVNEVLSQHKRGKISMRKTTFIKSTDEYFTVVLKTPTRCSWLTAGDCGNILASNLTYEEMCPQTEIIFEGRPGDWIDWSPLRRLSIGDFCGSPVNNIVAAAETVREILYDYRPGTSGPEYRISCRFYRNKSFARSKTNTTLVHEQGHFDIAEVYARKLNKALKEYQYKEQTFEVDVNGIYQAILIEEADAQEQYEQESNYGNNKEQQAACLLKIAADLKSYEAYANYNRLK